MGWDSGADLVWDCWSVRQKGQPMGTCSPSTPVRYSPGRSPFKTGSGPGELRDGPPMDEDPDWKGSWEEYVVGIQTKVGPRGAPKEFNSWVVQRRSIYGLLHLFHLGQVQGNVHTATPYEVTPWTP